LEDRDFRVHEVVLDNNLIIDELMLTLRGEIVDSVTNEIKKLGKPLVSDDTIAWIVGRILPYTSKIFSLSILDEAVVRQIIYEFESEISLELMFPDNLGIDRKNRDYIKWLMVHTMQVTAYKAMRGETLNKLLSQHHVQETSINHGDNPGLLSRFKL